MNNKEYSKQLQLNLAKSEKLLVISKGLAIIAVTLQIVVLVALWSKI